MYPGRSSNHEQSYNSSQPRQPQLQDGLAGQFDVWQPNASHSNPSTSGINNANRGAATSWQASRDSAFTEAYRSVDYRSSSGVSGFENNAANSAQYSVNPLDRVSASQQPMPHGNQFAGSGMSANIPLHQQGFPQAPRAHPQNRQPEQSQQQQFLSQIPTQPQHSAQSLSSHQQVPDFPLQTNMTQPQRYQMPSSVSQQRQSQQSQWDTPMPQQQTHQNYSQQQTHQNYSQQQTQQNYSRQHTQQNYSQQQPQQNYLSQMAQQNRPPQSMLQQHSPPSNVQPERYPQISGDQYPSSNARSNVQQEYNKIMFQTNPYASTNIASQREQPIHPSSVQSDQYSDSGLLSSTVQQQQYNQSFLANLSKSTNSQSPQSYGNGNSSAQIDATSWSAGNLGTAGNTFQNADSSIWSANDSRNSNSSTQQSTAWSQPFGSVSYGARETGTNCYNNPLDDASDDISAETLVSRLHESAAEQKEKLKGSQRPPSNFSKAALATLEKDLKAAAAPFESTEALLQFRNLQLGISSKTTDEHGQNEDQKKTAPSQTPFSSNLSAFAVEFIPKSKMPNAQVFRMLQECNKDETRKHASRENKTVLSVTVDSKFQYVAKTNENIPRSQSYRNRSKSCDFKTEFQKTESAESLLSKVCWNPLDGPIQYKKLPQSYVEKAEKSPAANHVVEKDQVHVNGNAWKDLKKSDKTPGLVDGKTVVTRVPCFDDHMLDQNSFLPLLGLFSITDLGYGSEEDVTKVLKRKVASVENLPSTFVDTEIDRVEEEAEALNMADEYINELTFKPAIFDSTVVNFIDALVGYHLSSSTITMIAEKIYEMCILEPNFRYLGSQLCDKLSRTNSGLSKFRSSLLSKAQNEFNAMDEDLSASSDDRARRARNFTQFTAELFLNLMLESRDGLERFAVLGRGTLGVVRKLVDHPNDANLQCSIKVLKLAITSLEESLRDDGKGSIEKLNKVLDDLEAIYRKEKCADVTFNELTLNLLSGFVKLREQNWGRESRTSSESSAKPDARPEHDENYYMNEPVFFTPAGKQYTAADAADPDFYRQYLAPYSVGYPGAEPFGEARADAKSTGANFSQNPLNDTESTAPELPYPMWSAGETQPYHSGNEYDDYEADYDAFLRSTGQM